MEKLYANGEKNQMLNAETLKTGVAKENLLDMAVVVHESIDSTSSWSLQQLKAGMLPPFACFAEQQTEGRGRRGKQWLMSAGSNIAMSLAWDFPLSCQQLHLLPLSIALAIAETLESYQLKNVQIKWPNDVYVAGRKVAGVLIETSPGSHSRLAVVIGIGVNYEMDDGTLSRVQAGLHNRVPVTDVCREFASQRLAGRPARARVADSLLQNAVAVCQQYPGESKNFLNKFRRRYDFCKGKRVDVILDNNEILSAVAEGVTDAAELIVRVDGEKRILNSADVSVRAGFN